MFTGIVEEMGVVERAGPRLVVRARKVLDDSGPGASVSVSGTCLTVVDRADGTLSFELSPETLSRTSLGHRRPGDRVNLERPATLLSRLGGHLVQGHVDGLGEVTVVEEVQPGRWMRIRVPDGLRRYLVEKGSVTVDGVSLTVAALDGDEFAVALIPFTLEATTLGGAAAGTPVNIEVDVVAKYVEGLVQPLRTERS